MAGLAVRQPSDQPITRVNALTTELSPVVNVERWARAVVYGEKYVEPDPEFISRNLALSVIMAESVDDVFNQAGVTGVQKLVPDTEGAEYGPFEITNFYVAASSFDAGSPCFVVITATMLDTGEEFKATTGATNIQATMIGLISNSVWPMRVKFKRGMSKDRGGRYLLFLMPPD